MEEPQTGLPQETGKPQQQTGIPQETEVFQDEKKELLRREEIKTMEKDISHLREMEAQKEKERLIALEAQREKERFSSPPPLQPREEIIKPVTEKPPAPIYQQPQPAKRIIFSKKVLIILVVLLVIGGACYWYFTSKKEAPAQENELPAVTPTTTEGAAEMPPEIIIPPSLITVQSTITLEATSSENIPQLLSQFLTIKGPIDGFTRILIKNTAENKLLGLNDFFTTFNIVPPAGLLDKLNNDFTLFVYSSNEVNRLGFVAEIKNNEGLYALGKAWEPTMEKNTENLFASLGETKTKYPTSFKQAFYKNFPFRYISLSNNKFGICWSAYNYFIWTTSGESMLRTIDDILSKQQ